MASPIQEDPAEAGRLGGIKSGETRRRKAAMRKDLLARQEFVDAAEDVAKELLAAAMGKGKWQQDGIPVLDPKDRAGLLKTCLEYGVGRPRAQDPMDTSDEEADSTGISFGVRQPDEVDSAEPGEPGEVRPQPPQG